MTVNRTEERLELTAIDRASQTINQVRGSVLGLKTGMDTLATSLAAVGSVVGLGAMGRLYADIVKSAAALDDMAASTGASVENLSKLQQVAKIGGHEFEGLTGQLAKMIKGLAAGDEEGGKAARALDFLGIKAKDANGVFRDTGDVLFEVSKKLALYENGGNKVALVQDLLGKGAERYIPLLEDMAEAGEVAATITGVQAAEAERLEKNYNRLTLQVENVTKAIALGFTPALVSLGDNMVAAAQRGTTAWQAMIETIKLSIAFLSKIPGLNPFGLSSAAADALFAWDEQQRSMRTGPNLWPGAAGAGGAPGSLGALDYQSGGGGRAGAAARASAAARAGRQTVLPDIGGTGAADSIIAEMMGQWPGKPDPISYLLGGTGWSDSMLAEMAGGVHQEVATQLVHITERVAEQNDRLAEQIQASLSDAIIDGLMDGFREGETIAEAFLRSLKSLFKTAVLQPLIQPLVAPVSGMMSGAGSSLANMLGLGGGGGGGGGFGGIANFLGGGSDIGGFLTGLTGGSGLTGTLMADSIMAEMVGGAAAGASGMAAGAGALSVLGPVGLGIGALALLGGGGLFGDDGPDHSDPRWDPRAIEHTDPRYGGTPRTPMAGFDAEAYLAANADVAASPYASHPYDHYVDWGQGEGRKLAPDDWAAQKAARAMEEAAASIEKLVDQEAELNTQIGTFVRGLPDRLGITSIQEAMNDLAISEYRSPLERLRAAEDAYAGTLASARSGDIGAVESLPAAVQSLLGIGRDVYASGPQFQALFVEANRGLSEIFAQQQALQNEVMSELQVTMQQASLDQVAEIRKQTATLAEGLASVQRELQLLRAAA